ncbi:hypothetical protein SAMN05443529_104177 [Desulfosporosinus hippei DSM 8344]|uniref:Uncharacterized protein n=1 Tax=Desulfosporosinus hippei DSM 8344 TaxID=1121419 RepID=A0A1G7VNQ2_9FIRM|nr:hypothetical protein SAMN05443529_104177 [Desulfosporosinus hippei DSM 8344]
MYSETPSSFGAEKERLGLLLIVTIFNEGGNLDENDEDIKNNIINLLPK